jgi:hypothetical protein
MKYRLLFTLITMLCSFAIGQVNTLEKADNKSQKNTAAMLEFQANGVQEFEVRTITENLSSELTSIGKFRLLERGQMDEILKEQGFQESGLCDASSCEVEMGQLLGVDKLITGSVGRLGKTFTLTGRIISVESGEVLISATEKFTGEIDGLLLTSTPRLAQKLSGNQVAPLVQTPKEPVAVKVETMVNQPQDKKSNNMWVKMSTGLLTLAAGGAAYYFNTQVAKHNKDATASAAELNSKKTALAKAIDKKDMDTSLDSAEEAANSRNIMGAVAGVGLIGFGMSFAF